MKVPCQQLSSFPTDLHVKAPYSHLLMYYFSLSFFFTHLFFLFKKKKNSFILSDFVFLHHLTVSLTYTRLSSLHQKNEHTHGHVL